MTDITVVGAGGEYMESVVVVAWHKQPGETVAAGEIIVTVETAKAATDIEAPSSGVLEAIRAKVGEEVAVGSVLGSIADGSAAPAPKAAPSASLSAAVTPVAAASAPVSARPAGGRVKASPLARRVAAERGIDLAALTASSPSGRIKLRDVPQSRMTAAGPVAAAAATSGAVNIVRRGSGSGAPFVFLHGFGADGPSWQPLLAALGPDSAAVLVDLPGHGRSPALPGRCDLPALAAAVGAALSEAGIEECHLVGHSLGGALALALTEAGRIAPRSLTLLAPAGLGPEIDGDFLEGYGRATRPESLQPWLARLVADATLITPGYVQAVLAARSEAQRAAQTAIAAAVFPDGTQGFDLRATLRRLTLPVKILWGTSDRIIPMRHALGAGPAAGVHLLPEVGHMPQFEAPALVARLLLQNARSAG